LINKSGSHPIRQPDVILGLEELNPLQPHLGSRDFQYHRTTIPLSHGDGSFPVGRNMDVMARSGDQAMLHDGRQETSRRPVVKKVGRLFFRMFELDADR